MLVGLEGLVSRAQDLPVPESYGIYFVSDGRLTKAENAVIEGRFEAQGPLFDRLLGIRQLSGVELASDAAVMLYGPHLAPPIATEARLLRLRFVAGQEESAFLWVAEDTVSTQLEPVPEHADLFRLTPMSSLANGTYALDFGDMDAPVEAFVDFVADFRVGSFPAPADPETAEELVAVGEPAIPSLVLALGHSDQEVRGLASWALSTIGPKAVPALISALRDDDAERSRAAAEALGRMLPEATPALIASLLAEDGVERQAAAQALGEMVPEAVSHLVDALQREDALGVAQVLGEMGPVAREAVPALIEILQDEDLAARRLAAEVLGKIGLEEAIPALLAAAPDVPGGAAVAVRQMAGEALAKIGARPALIEAVADDDVAVRRVAVEALAVMGLEGREAIAALIKALRDEDMVVRTLAVRALGDMGAEAIPALIEAVEDDEPTARREAARALGRMGPEAPEAVPILIEALRDEGGDGSAYASALSYMGPEAVPALLEALRDEDWVVRALVSQC
jgi:HEAT repeat protein